MKYKIIKPQLHQVNKIIDLCSAHATYEKSEYDRTGKEEKLSKSLFSERPKLQCRVAEVKGMYIGYIVWMNQYSTWDASEYYYMDCLFLEEHYRGHGIGEALVNNMKEEAESEGIFLVQWQTPAFNERAIKFYKRIGASALSKERFFLKINS